MGRCGRQQVEQHYSMGAMVRKYQALYDRLLHKRVEQTTQQTTTH